MNRIPAKCPVAHKLPEIYRFNCSASILFDLFAGGFSKIQYKISDKMEQIELSKVCYVINV